ncbi:MAG: hypothetical protein JWO38_5352 [Gemmataceae bacterium]|nr:hypothetical protein [Gemmataceae bacterium]
MSTSGLRTRVDRMEQELQRLSKAIPEHLAIVADGNFSVKEAVKASGLSRPELYKMMTQRQLTFIQHGKRRLIPKRARMEFLAVRLVPAD